MESSDDEHPTRAEQLAARKRYNMKSLGRLVDSNRATGATAASPTQAPVASPPPVSPVTNVPQIATAAPTVNRGPVAAPAPAATPTPVRAPTPASVPVSAPDVEQVAVPVLIEVADAAPHATSTDTLLEPVRRNDSIDRSDMGSTVTKTGLSALLDGPKADEAKAPQRPRRPVAEIPLPEPGPSSPLARQMLDGEVARNGRISDPRDVPGLVLNLAKDVPASVAVSVVRIDEEIEIVGDTVDPSIDSTKFSVVFSGLFRAIRPAARVLEDGPMGPISDVVIEGEKMDLVLRPLGSRYYLMVVEDRKDARANLASTRLHMAAIAPGLTAILAQQDGEI